MRKKVTVQIAKDGSRDNGKVFVVEEMSAYDAEWWGTRVAAALIRENPDIGERIGSGLQAVALAGLRALIKLPAQEFFDLGNDLIGTVKIKRDPKGEALSELMPDDIEEVETRMRLKIAAFELNVGFSIAELKSMLTSVSASTNPPQE